MADKPEVSVIRWYKRSAAWRRLAADGGAFSVGSVAAVVSWKHIVHTSLMLHQDTLAAYLYPVSIDGMMIVGVVKAADDRASGRKVRGWARVATWVGGVLSVNAQVMSAYAYGALAAAWSVVPSATLIIVVEVMSRRGKLLPVKPGPEPVEKPADAPVALPEPVPAPVPVEAPVAITEAAAAPLVEDVASEDAEITSTVIEGPRKPRRRARRTGYAGAGASDAELDAAMAELKERRTTDVPDADMVTVSDSVQ